jgi:hypothetical protein
VLLRPRSLRRWCIHSAVISPEGTADDDVVAIGLAMDPGKVTYNGVQIGRVARIDEVNVGGEPRPRSRPTWIPSTST